MCLIIISLQSSLIRTLSRTSLPGNCCSRSWAAIPYESSSTANPRHHHQTAPTRRTRTRRFSHAAASTAANHQPFILVDPSPAMVDLRRAPSDFDPSSAVVYQDFATLEEAAILEQEIKTRLKRRRYEKGHWDAVIVQYKETELLDESSMLSPTSQALFHRVRHQLQERHFGDTPQQVQWLPCHAIDLHKDGELHAHVDSVRFSGHLVAGLSLVSSSIMRFLPAEATADDNDDSTMDRSKSNTNNNDTSRGWVDLYLPPRSLYVMSGPARYHYSHQLLPTGSIFVNSDHPNSPITVIRDHRFSVIFRDSKDEEQ